jgi:hypothetical protein
MGRFSPFQIMSGLGPSSYPKGRIPAKTRLDIDLSTLNLALRVGMIPLLA